MPLPKIKAMATGAPFRDGLAVTPSDTVDLAESGILYLGQAGDIAVITDGGSEITFKNHPIGYVPGIIRRVKATGTSAAFMLLLY